MSLYLIILFYLSSSQLIAPFKASELCRIVVDKYDRAAMMSRNVVTGRDNRWPNGIIPYAFGNNFTDLETRMIYLAMNHISNNSGVVFVPRSSDNFNFVNLTNDELGCYTAGSGYHAKRGAQKLNLMRHGCMRVYHIVHELLHVLGFFHEQSRPDRDNYLDIIWDNIVQHPLYFFQFARAKTADENLPQCNLTLLTPYNDCYNGYTVTTFGLPYDYLSVMHYFATAFTRNGKPTMSPKNYTGLVGSKYGNGLTELDIKKLQMAYPESCMAKSGYPCIFPFMYNGQKYTKCTTKNNKGIPWCAVGSLKENGEVYSYSNCPSSCPVYKEPEEMPTANSSSCLTTAGFLCTFPFTYKGSNYTSCTEEDFPGTKWCATETNNGVYNGHYGTCGQGCSV